MVFLLLDFAVVIVLAKSLGALARRLDQPAVIGEILAGVLLGPTLLGDPVAGALVPTDVRPLLTVLADLGVILFMYQVGVEFDRRALRGRGGTVSAVALASIVVPFGTGALLALRLTDHQPHGEKMTFVLFMGTAMSITAFPVLARILTDRAMLHSDVGRLALAAAAVGDAVAWALLAVVVAMAGAGGGQWKVLLLIPYAAALLYIGRPLLRRLLTAGGDRAAHRRPAITMAGLLLSSALTEWMGLHFLFGAFLFGVAMPEAQDRRLREDTANGLAGVAGLLLPVYFVIAGIRVDLSGVGSADLGELGLILAVAMGGKFLGVFTAARLGGVDARESATLALLMNTRGLTELIVLTVGLGLGLLDTGLYSLMVVMAVVTTALAGPLLRILHPRPRRREDPGRQALETGANGVPGPPPARP
ncbi:hypothetical protein GCM10010269_50780 [Streptomyces humidus]|uniref:Cation/H+ exchanger transmembrane domain-containing protein n=1 Tax=Streptomyces humidus TaxID=52259 RepID=A0A918FZ00_9ACTN|nr:hypothetical protein GCM10010269_50780 [Streptomyces humidus]